MALIVDSVAGSVPDQSSPHDVGQRADRHGRNKLYGGQMIGSTVEGPFCFEG